MTYDEWKANEPDPNESSVEDCGDCGGQGFYCFSTEDDEMADREHTCPTCGGTGEQAR